ncbi:hypothetical protein DID80_02280 [Candidatus Marinamargulisbacteria bacterium SCGC AAA071-K20]|nr:hypothetical protein DID80_02280 [Candidatus Marinamargulisbacteria bacterium SCGC AAA071-K20]
MFDLATIFTRERSKSLRSVSVSVKIGKRLSLAWTEIFKGRMAEDLSFGYYKKFALGIYSTNYCWINEIQAHKDIIIKRIEEVLDKKGIVKYLKVHHMPEGAPKKEIRKPNEAFLRLSFKEKIKKTNELKRLRGDRLCDTCKVVYTKKGRCVFCETGHL